MKKFLKILGILILTILLIVYLAFLFVLPNVIDINQYKPMIQQIIKEQAHLDLDIGEIKLVTTPLLSAGIKTDKVIIKYEDGSELLKTDGIKARISLPSLLLYTVKVSCLEIENPKINLTIDDGKNPKILKLIDDIIAEQQKNIDDKKEPETKQSFIDPSKIKIKVPNAKLKNYQITADDTKNKHNLVLKGDEFTFGYFNGKTIKAKTNAQLISDGKTNINANINIDTFLPPPNKLDEEDDKMQRAEMPYANIVEIYRTYDLKVNADTKLKIREKDGKYKLWGYANIDDLTLKLSNYSLPKSYAHVKFCKDNASVDTDIKVADNQAIKILGKIKYNKNPKADLSIHTDRIYFKSLMNFAKGVMDTFHIQNDLAAINTDGYFLARTNFKTNFKNLKSDGYIFIREGQFKNPKTGLNISNATADILLENNTLNIKDTKINVDNTPVTIQGTINEKSVADIKIKADNIPLKGFYNTFAPRDLRKTYNLNSGNISLDVNLAGELKKAVLTAKSSLDNFSFSDVKKSLIITNEKAKLDLSLDSKNLNTNLENKNLQISMPQTKSNIKNSDLKINIDNENIMTNESKIIINNNSEIKYNAKVQNWQNQKKMLVNIIADGKLNAQNLKQFAGKDAAMFIDARGTIPLNVKISGEGKRQNILLQLSADKDNYITPVNIAALYGKDSVLQVEIAYKGDHLKIKETGLFEKTYSTDPETNETKTNLTEIIGLEGTVTSLKSEPFINLFTVRIPKDLAISVNGFKRADFILGGKLYTYGRTSNPRYQGGFYVKDLKIDDLYTSVKQTDLKLMDRNLNVNISDILLNGSDVNITAKANLTPSSIFTIEDLNIKSQKFDVDKTLKVVEAMNKFLPKSNTTSASSKSSDIPVEIKNGAVNVSWLKTGNIVVTDILSRLSLAKNVLYLNNLNAKAFDGSVLGDISMNLISGILHIEMNGKNINSAKAALDTAGLKDIIFGTLSFDTDLAINATAPNFEAQMKSIDGVVNFVITNGQIGPFGKMENMILAENIRESSFFQTALGGVISNLTTIDTTHFKNMNGHIELKDAIVHIIPITSKGNVLNLYITGDMDILKNTLDMKVRVKLGSEISNMLGPIAALNPINLVKATPGLNVAMAKAFTLFTEEISADEMNAIPKFDEALAEFYSTKFQIVLRGDVSKPLKLIKSFKWLATSTEIAEAQNYVSSLPDPVTTEDGTVLTTAEEINAYNEYNSRRSTKIKKAIKKIFTKEKKTTSSETTEQVEEVTQEISE